MLTRRSVGVAIGLACAALVSAWLLLVRPSTTRDWAVDQSVPATALIDGHRLTVRNVRDFRYDPGGAPLPRWYDATYDLDSIESAWLGLTRFSATSQLPAHTFVSFGFADGRFLAISVEARRERDEAYGMVAGLFRRFELIYVVGDERDLVGRRALVDGDDTFLYPVRGSREAMRAALLGMLARAEALERRPEFYNSIWNNCTSNLVRHVNAVSPGRIPAGWRVLVPGYADAVAARLGLIADAGGDLATLRNRWRVNARAREATGAASFSAAIRGEPGTTGP